MADREFLVKLFDEINISLSEKQVEQFFTYYTMLAEKNKVMNLTAITEYEDVVVKHFVDSALLNQIIDLNKVDSVIDVGTGAGFPGIPLKIVFPHLKITLLDSLNKRINFLKEVVDKLEFDNVECIHGRAEDFGHDEDYREKFDLCVSRAVANLSTLSEYCVPFIKVNGMFISYKSANLDEELINSENAIKVLGCSISDNKSVILPGTDDNTVRKFIVIKKGNNLSKKYPRKAGLPSKEPL